MPEIPESVAALARARDALNDAVDRIMADMASSDAVSRVGIAMLRDAADQVRRAVPPVGKLRGRKSL